MIDVFSKYAFAIPIKDKSSKEICKAFKIVFAQRKPLKLRTDKGKEFLHNELKNLCQDLKINFFTSSDGESKCSVIERFNRTLMEKMFKYFTFKGSRRYIDIVSTLVTTYNNTIHSSIKMKPSAVTEDNSSVVFKNIYGFESFRDLLKNRKSSKKIKAGDTVRVKYEKKPLYKGYYFNWTDKSETVENIIEGDYKPFYKLHNIRGRFYPQEIQKISKQVFRIERILQTRTRNGEKECLVKWLGYPSSYNSWEPLKNIKYGSAPKT